VYGALSIQTLVSAVTFLAAKQALSELRPSALAMLRFSGASALFAVLLVGWARPRLPPRRWWGRIALLGLLGVPLNQGLLLGGLSLTTPAHAAILYSLTPLFVFVMAVALGAERPDSLKFGGLVLALAGAMVVVFARTGDPLAAGARTGDLLVLGAVIAWAAYTTLGRPLTQAHGPIAATSWTMIAGTLLFVPLGVPGAAAAPLGSLTRMTWGALAFLIVLTSVVAYLCWYYALRALEPSRVAVFTNLQPVGTAALSWLLFDEPVTPTLVGGGALVLGGVLLTTQVDAWRARKAALT
jgi:drug/metabolite transporter (DMT)-like permease